MVATDSTEAVRFSHLILIPALAMQILAGLLLLWIALAIASIASVGALLYLVPTIVLSALFTIRGVTRDGYRRRIEWVLAVAEIAIGAIAFCVSVVTSAWIITVFYTVPAPLVLAALRWEASAGERSGRTG